MRSGDPPRPPARLPDGVLGEPRPVHSKQKATGTASGLRTCAAVLLRGSYGRGSKLNRGGKPRVLVHVSTSQGNPFWNSGCLSHSHLAMSTRNPRKKPFSSPGGLERIIPRTACPNWGLGQWSESQTTPPPPKEKTKTGPRVCITPSPGETPPFFSNCPCGSRFCLGHGPRDPSAPFGSRSRLWAAAGFLSGPLFREAVAISSLEDPCH